MLPVFLPVPETAAGTGTGSAPPFSRPSGENSDRMNNKHNDRIGRDTGAGGSGGQGEKGGRKKRVMTEARKEQNRASQKAFRQRQKQRREELAAKASVPLLNPPLRPRVATKDADPPFPAATAPSPSQCRALEPWQDAFQILGSSLSEGLAGSDDSQCGSLWDVTAAVAADVQSHSPLVPSQNASRFEPSTAITTSSDFLPDPCANAIRLLPTTVFSAILHNALALGIDPSVLAGCNADARRPSSPFFRPNCPGTDPAALLAGVRNSLPPGAPSHLIPTLAQVLVPHHASLDLIPVPLLRERAILLSAAMPSAYDLHELKLDIYVRRGLTVWAHDWRRGPGTGGAGMGGCQPWDMRSWEAAPWFLRKWSVAVDGEGGELSKQSAWFRALRGGGSVTELY